MKTAFTLKTMLFTCAITALLAAPSFAEFDTAPGQSGSPTWRFSDDVRGLGIPEETWALVAAADGIPEETWALMQASKDGIPEETWALEKAADGIPEETWAILKNAEGIPEEVYALKANLDGIPEETWAMRNAEFAGDVFNNPVSPKLTLKAAGPLAIGLGAIIAIGAIRNGDSAADTSQ